MSALFLIAQPIFPVGHAPRGLYVLAENVPHHLVASPIHRAPVVQTSPAIPAYVCRQVAVIWLLKVIATRACAALKVFARLMSAVKPFQMRPVLWARFARMETVSPRLAVRLTQAVLAGLVKSALAVCASINHVPQLTQVVFAGRAIPA